MTMKYALVPLLIAALMSVAALPAFAESGSSHQDKKQEKEHKVLQTLLRKSGPSVHIGAGGRAQLDAATITAVSGSDLTVKLFGQTYKVNTKTAEKTEGTLTVDGRVWIKGIVNESTGVIDANSLRTFTARVSSDDDDDDTATSTDKKGRSMESFQKQIEQLMEKLKKLRGN